jgi:hypothetical protein
LKPKSNEDEEALAAMLASFLKEDTKQVVSQTNQVSHTSNWKKNRV